jgi:hypothetical protein
MWERSYGWALAAVLSFAASGCATTPPAISSSRTPLPVQPKASVSEPTCSSCREQIREIERLRQALATRDEEVRELRSDQRVKVKVLQESKREVTRAKVKLRRLSTRADAASYIAEVEVAMESLRSSRGATSSVPQIIAAQRLLESTAEPFAQGDYGVAMDRAAEAEHLISWPPTIRPDDRHLRRRKRRSRCVPQWSRASRMNSYVAHCTRFRPLRFAW